MAFTSIQNIFILSLHSIVFHAWIHSSDEIFDRSNWIHIGISFSRGIGALWSSRLKCCIKQICIGVWSGSLLILYFIWFILGFFNPGNDLLLMLYNIRVRYVVWICSVIGTAIIIFLYKFRFRSNNSTSRLWFVFSCTNFFLLLQVLLCLLVRFQIIGVE